MNIEEMNEEHTRRFNDSEKEVRQLLNDYFTAISEKDVDQLMSFYSDDIIAFDLVAPLQFKGKVAYRKSWEEAFAACKDDPSEVNETKELKITADDNMAFSHSLHHNIMVSNEGKKMEMWMRSTNCLKKINGKWLIVHEQFSVPADFENGKALFNLSPDTRLH
jgi:uncharacterized protein (TIGR02246 family)